MNCKNTRILVLNIGILFSCAAHFGSTDLIDLFTSSIETHVKEDVLAKQLFLDLFRFLLGWSLYLTIISEIVSSSRQCVWVGKL